MTTGQYLTYQKFNDKDNAIYLAGLLKEHDIDVQLEDYTTPFDPSFANNEQTKEFRLKIREEDFEKADGIQLEISGQLLENIDRDYHLFTFSNDELLEILAKSDEWSKFDYLLAWKILAERGKPIDEDRLNKLKRRRIKSLSKPEGNQNISIIAGYILSVSGGLPGIIIGWFLSTHKKTLPNGSRVYGYTPDVRKHGRRIVLLGVVIFVVWVIVVLAGWG
jgi:hypothetical protein